MIVTEDLSVSKRTVKSDWFLALARIIHEGPSRGRADACSERRNRQLAPEAYFQYVEEPIADFFFQSAWMCDRSRTFMNNAG